MDLSNLGLTKVPYLITLLPNLRDLNLNNNPDLQDMSVVGTLSQEVRSSVIDHALKDTRQDDRHTLAQVKNAINNDDTTSEILGQHSKDVLTYIVPCEEL